MEFNPIPGHSTSQNNKPKRNNSNGKKSKRKDSNSLENKIEEFLKNRSSVSKDPKNDESMKSILADKEITSRNISEFIEASGGDKMDKDYLEALDQLYAFKLAQEQDKEESVDYTKIVASQQQLLDTTKESRHLGISTDPSISDDLKENIDVKLDTYKYAVKSSDDDGVLRATFNSLFSDSDKGKLKVRHGLNNDLNNLWEEISDQIKGEGLIEVANKHEKLKDIGNLTIIDAWFEQFMTKGNGNLLTDVELQFIAKIMDKSLTIQTSKDRDTDLRLETTGESITIVHKPGHWERVGADGKSLPTSGVGLYCGLHAMFGEGDPLEVKDIEKKKGEIKMKYTEKKLSKDEIEIQNLVKQIKAGGSVPLDIGLKRAQEALLKNTKD